MPIELIERSSPVIVTLPYTGTNMPRFFVDRVHDPDQFMIAPDHGLDRLLHGLVDDFSILRANFHRYLSDVDRVPPNGETRLSKGMIGVVPVLDERGAIIWDRPPSPRDAATWRAMYYAPYHAALAAQIARARARHGYAVIVNCHAMHTYGAPHSVPPHVDVRLSTYLSTSCTVDLTASLTQLLRANAAHVTAVGGRNDGGATIRHYGHPKSHVHAFDLCLNDARYLRLVNRTPLYDPEKAASLRSSLQFFMRYVAGWQPKNLI